MSAADSECVVIREVVFNKCDRIGSSNFCNLNVSLMEIRRLFFPCYPVSLIEKIAHEIFCEKPLIISKVLFVLYEKTGFWLKRQILF